MFNKRIFSTFVFVTLLALAAMTANAQTEEKARGWAARGTNPATTAERIPALSDFAAEEKAAPASGFLDLIERDKEARRKALVGAWRISIAPSAGGFPAFNALHTFHSGGTFNEASDLLPTLTETPAFGVWDLDGDKYVLTFELFAFDDKKAPVGIIRVRCSIRLINADEFSADSVVDFIAPDGTVQLGIDSGPFTGKRVKAMAAK